ncbi:MAG: DNA repair protein RecO [Clostridiales bacterium]|nr:DNA repair protein RecO [Clostridiales bacterium]
MLETKVKAIVVSSKDYKEKDKLVTLFTLEQGLVNVLFKSVKNSNAKLKSAKELFSFGDFIYAQGVFNTVTSAEIISTFYDITKNIHSYYAACNILTIIKTILPQGETSPQLFVQTLKCLQMLEENQINHTLILNKFLISVFEGFGYKFDLNACNNCGVKFLGQRYMNLRYGDITCARCRVGEVEELSPAVYSSLRMLAITPTEQLSTLKLPNDIITQIFNLLSKNFEKRFGTLLDNI